MARYELTVEEYRRYNHSPIARPWKRYLAWSIGLVVLTTSLFVGQYAFSVLWAALLVFVFFTFHRMAPRIEANRLANNPFARGPFEVEFRPESYVVRVGETELRLNLSEFGLAHDLKNHYRLDHKSGFVLEIPKRALSEEEEAIISSYRARFPGRPENKTIPKF